MNGISIVDEVAIALEHMEQLPARLDGVEIVAGTGRVERGGKLARKLQH